MLAFESGFAELVIGAITGLTYGALGCGIVLVYRASRTVNLAHGEIGALGAAVLAKLMLDHGWPFVPALLLVLAVGALIGAVVEVVVVRRLAGSPRVAVLVATIGVSQLLFAATVALPGVRRAAPFPTPIDRVWEVGGLVVRGEHFFALAVLPAVVVGLGLALQRTRWGLALRAAADEPDVAQLAAISVRRASTSAWAVAGALAVLTAVVVSPLRGTIVGLPTTALGPAVLLRGLAAALAGRFHSLPATLLGGVVLGIVEAVLFVELGGGSADAVLLGAVLVLVLLRGRTLVEGTGVWSTGIRPIPPLLQRLPVVSVVRRISPPIAVGVAIAAPFVYGDASDSFLLSRVVLTALAAISVTVLTGWGGQLSLGQGALVGVGSFVTAGLIARGVGFVPAIASATVAGVLLSLLVGFPALRAKGLALAVTTLALAVAAHTWLLPSTAFLGDERVAFVPRPVVLGLDLAPQRTYYLVCLAILVVVGGLVARLRTTGAGRTIVAVRENEGAAASFGVAPSVVKLGAFALAGGIAGLAGALLAGLRTQFSASAFGPEESLQIVATAVIGGLGSVTGAVLGAVFVVGLPFLLGESQAVTLLTSGVGLLVLLLYLPGGIVQLLGQVRDGALGLLAARRLRQGTLPPIHVRTPGPVPTRPPRSRAEDDRPPLEVRDLHVRYGGVAALAGVSLEARPGEVLGLIGANGAGKSTLLDAISGFAPVASGEVLLHGQDVTAWPAHRRAAVPVGRVFQDARLFGDLTVRETIMVAAHEDQRSELLPNLLAFAPARRIERHRREVADTQIDLLGLGPFAGRRIADLSTGSRRIVEVACLLAQGADLLLLDEPTAGIAQREAEAFGPLLRRVREELGATIVLIEHDMPLVMSLCDRICCLEVGRVLVHGTPDEVRHDPRVIASYLGTDERAIARSGAVT